MNFLFVALVIPTLMQSTYGLTTDALAAIIAKDQAACLQSAPIPDEVREQLSNNVLVESDALKKFAFCMQVLIGFMNPDGTYNKEGIKHTTADVVGSNQYDSLVDECTKLQSKDGIANAWNLAKCAHDNVHNNKFFEFVDKFWSLPK